MKKHRLLISIPVMAAVLAFGGIACGDDNKDTDGGVTKPTATVSEGETPQAGTTIDVSLTEYVISPDPASAPAGPVTFNAGNIGGEDHELVIIKTDLAPDALPTAENGSVDEAGAGIEVIDEIGEFAAGGEESLTVDLDAGNYVLICNIVETEANGTVSNHYANGMSAAFEVTE